MSWDFFYLFALWHILLNRKQNIFNSNVRAISIHHLIACILEFKYTTHTIGCENKHSDVMVRWFPLLMGGIKLTLDGSDNNDHRLNGIGGVFCDYQGKWIALFYKK